jgi:hypothetical protein
MTIQMRRGIAAAIVVLWVFAIHRDALLLLESAINMLRSGAVLLITGIATWAAVYVVGHPEVIRTAAKEAKSTFTNRL